MLTATIPDVNKYRIATFNLELHQNGIHPGNHNVEYRHGWYYLDGQNTQRPETTRKSRSAIDRPDIEVFFSEPINSYVLCYVDRNGYPTQQQVQL